MYSFKLMQRIGLSSGAGRPGLCGRHGVRAEGAAFVLDALVMSACDCFAEGMGST